MTPSIRVTNAALSMNNNQRNDAHHSINKYDTEHEPQSAKYSIQEHMDTQHKQQSAV